MKMTNTDIDERFDDGESVMAYADLSRAERPNRVRRVNVDFPAWMVDALDREARHLNVPRQALIKMMIANSLKQSALVTAQ